MLCAGVPLDVIALFITVGATSVLGSIVFEQEAPKEREIEPTKEVE